MRFWFWPGEFTGACHMGKIEAKEEKKMNIIFWIGISVLAASGIYWSLPHGTNIDKKKKN